MLAPIPDSSCVNMDGKRAMRISTSLGLSDGSSFCRYDQMQSTPAPNGCTCRNIEIKPKTAQSVLFISSRLSSCRRLRGFKGLMVILSRCFHNLLNIYVFSRIWLGTNLPLTMSWPACMGCGLSHMLILFLRQSKLGMSKYLKFR